MENKNQKVVKNNNSGGRVTETQIKTMFQECETWADANKVIDLMSVDQVIAMKNALNEVDKYTELTMRDEFVLSLLEFEIEERAKEGEKNGRRK
jgi:hypothetical protein